MVIVVAVCGGPDAAKTRLRTALPAPTNIAGVEYPRVTPDLRAIFRVKAPDAQKVEFNLGKHYAAVRDADGFWTATTEPQAPGFHYYWLVIDGVQVNDPGSETFLRYGQADQRHRDS